MWWGVVVPEGVPIFKYIRRYKLPEMGILLSMDGSEDRGWCGDEGGRGCRVKDEEEGLDKNSS